AQASPALGGEQTDRHAIALSSRDTPSRRFGLQRCAATPAKSLKLFVRAGAQPPAWSSFAPEEVRSPPAPQMRDTGRTAASRMAETSLVACRLPFGTILFPTACDIPACRAASSLVTPAAIAAQNRRCSSRPATTGRPGENNGARPDRSERRLRLVIATPPSRCCDDHLSPASMPPSLIGGSSRGQA